MTAPSGTSTQYTADLSALTGTSSNIAALAGQSSSTVADLGKLVVDVISFAQIGSTVGTANTSLQSSLTQALGKVSAVLQDVGKMIGTSAQGYATADQTVAESLGKGASTTAGSAAAATTKPGTDGDAFIDNFAANRKQGATGSTVKEFQKELTQLGYDPGAPDGQWGPGTQKAFEAYTTQHHYVAGA